MVFISGPDAPFEVEKIMEAAKKSGLRICVIGDCGKTSFLSKELLKQQLTGKIDENTNIYISGHGAAGRLGIDNYNSHVIDLYPTQVKTLQVLADLNAIFHNDARNKDKQMMLGLVSCYGGTARNDAPNNIKLTIHSDEAYVTLGAIGNLVMVKAIEARIKNIDV